ncbi:unnamed protein product [Ambrosiozyma monospora]|uniref:Unnamed protein product n=1 Tax=Ambrosiozyma monospora TaxID=43982 RepID=A0ACB5SUE2_AMBMO|nr:unnamed protein product [Ambrosiozyma monospora]
MAPSQVPVQPPQQQHCYFLFTNPKQHGDPDMNPGDRNGANGHDVNLTDENVNLIRVMMIRMAMINVLFELLIRHTVQMIGKIILMILKVKAVQMMYTPPPTEKLQTILPITTNQIINAGAFCRTSTQFYKQHLDEHLNNAKVNQIKGRKRKILETTI